MVLFDLLKMTKEKILILVLLLVFLSPSYLNIGCITGICSSEIEVCACGFLPLEFFVTFLWVYVIAAFIVEFALMLRKIINKK